MSDFRILHLSDVHFGCGNLEKDQELITEELARAARRHVDTDPQGIPDLLVFSGDLAQSGQPDEFDQGGRWLKRIADEFDCPIFIVPGNHDVERPALKSEGYRNAFKQRASVGDRDGYATIYPELSEAKSLENFRAWHARFKSSANVTSDWSASPLGCWATVRARGGRTVRVLGLNTALFSMDNDDKGRLVADIGALNEFLSEGQADNSLRIVVTHHPVDVVGRQSLSWLQGWNNERLSTIFGQTTGPHIYLHGHTHDSVGVACSTIRGQSLFSYGAGAAYQGADWPQIFAFFELNYAKQSIKPTAYKFSTGTGQWEFFQDHSHDILAVLPQPEPGRVATQAPGMPRAERSLPNADSNAVRLLDDISDSCAERFMPRTAVENAVSRKRLIKLFDELLESTMKPIGSYTDEILDRLAEQKQRLWAIIGEMGAGKAEFMALLYWVARHRIREGHEFPHPVFIDSRTWDERAGDRAEAVIAAAAKLGPSVVFVCDMDVSQGEADLGGFRLADRMKEAGAIKVVARHERLPEELGDRMIRVRTPQHDSKLVERYVVAMEPMINEPVTPAWPDQLKKLVEQICRDHRIPVSMYLIRECGIAVARHPGVRSLSDALRARLSELSARAPRWSVGQMAARAFEAFKERSHYAGNRGELMMQLESNCPADVRRLLSTHPSAEHWLVALHAFTMFETIGCHLVPPAVPASTSPVPIDLPRLYAELRYVFPAHINAFTKELFAQSLAARRPQVTAAVTHILDGDIRSVGRLLKAHACYLAGRLPATQQSSDFAETLRKNANLAETDLKEVRALRASGRSARTLGGKEMEKRLAAIAHDLFGTDAEGAWDSQLHTIARELLLLQRSALISLAYLEDRIAAKEYIDGLLSDVDKDDMNRGFHLEYYGDVEFRPKKPLLSTDSHLRECPQSFAALMECLAKYTTSTSLAMIQAATLASLARHRHASAKLDDDVRQRIVSTLEKALGASRDESTLAEFLKTTIAELAQKEFVVERYVDGLYELKYQRRAGWENLRPAESVAAHMYFVELLARLFISERTVDRERVLRLVSHHDLAEAIVGDTQIDLRGDEARKREHDVILRIAQLGSLTGSVQFNELTADYERFERRGDSAEDRIARDLDRLDLLIQLMRYRRENADVPRYSKFREFVEPAKFKDESMQLWAKRFLRYFDAQIEAGVSAHDCTQPLWPHPVLSKRIHENAADPADDPT